MNATRGTSVSYSVSVSPTGTVASPVSATISLAPTSNGVIGGDFSSTGYSLMRTINSQAVNIDPNASLVSSGTLPTVTGLEVPVSFQLTLPVNANATVGATYDFTISLTDAKGSPLGSNTETFVIQ